MRRERGFTMIELMTCLGLIGAVATVATMLTLDAHRTAALAEAYEADVTATRRALDAVERDVRAAHDVRTDGASLVAGDVAWRLDGDALRRDGVVVARNVAKFDAERRADLVEVKIELGRRSPNATRTARVSTTARMRAPREAAK